MALLALHISTFYTLACTLTHTHTHYFSISRLPSPPLLSLATTLNRQKGSALNHWHDSRKRRVLIALLNDATECEATNGKRQLAPHTRCEKLKRSFAKSFSRDTGRDDLANRWMNGVVLRVHIIAKDQKHTVDQCQLLHCNK